MHIVKSLHELIKLISTNLHR